MKKNNKKENKTNSIIWFSIKMIIMVLVLVFSIYSIKVIHDLDMLPKKIFIVLVIIYSVFNILNILGLIVKKKVLNIIAVLLSIIILVVSILGIKHGTNIANFMNSAFNNNGIEVTEYNIAVLKSSNYNDVNSLEGKVVGYSILDENEEEYLSTVNSIVNAEFKSYDNPMFLYEDLVNKKLDAIILTDGYFQLLEDEYNDIDDKVKVIYNFEMKKEIETETVSKEEVFELKPVNILISGSDSRSGVIVDKTRSDVNMIVTINPKTHKVLLTSIPRDYYVQVHGKTGTKDKLTHSGIYGVNTTKKTVEDLFEIKIDYTIKVGFQSVVKVVDIVDGVDIDSDTAFQTRCGDGVPVDLNVKYGMNHFDGSEALCYARERHAYRNGDHHRIQNQQQVLEAVIKKISKNKSLLLKYDKILDSLKNTYKTNIPSDFIKEVVKEQIDNMPSWNIKKQQVTGSGAMLETYTAPGKRRSVVVPNMSSVKKASENIESFMSEE